MIGATGIEARRDAIQLTTIGSSSLQVRAAPAALVMGGVQIEQVSHVGTVLERCLTLSLTAAEARLLVDQIERALASPGAKPPLRDLLVAA